MLFWLFVIITIVGILIACFSYDFDWFGEATAFIGGIATVISLIIIIAQFATVDSNLEANREIFKALTYKVESEDCRDEFGLLNKEVIDEIQDWNKDVRFYQSIQNNFWVGIYYPNVFDEFETIDYESFNGK